MVSLSLSNQIDQVRRHTSAVNPVCTICLTMGCSETTRLRIVYNGSAKAYGAEQSLNNCLQTGPNYIPKLFDILFRFRWHKIVITADIEKVFLMIHISEADRDFLRFLWIRDPFQVPHELVHLRFTRLVFGLQPSPAILGEVLLHHHIAENQASKILGVMWDHISDTFRFDLTHLES